MALTEFGKEIRKARVEIGQTLRTMASELGASPSLLSGFETGTKTISSEWLGKIEQYLTKYKYKVSDLSNLAAASNNNVSLHDGLSHQQKMLVAGFAHSPFTPDELKKFAELLKEVNEKREVEANE